MDHRSKTTPHFKNGFRRQCKTENFVPIVVPGLSTSSSSSLPSSTHMTHLRQEIDHSKSASSSSTSTLTTSSTEIDHSDHPPAIVSSESVDRQTRRDPYSSETSEELLTKPTKVKKKEWITIRYGETRAIPKYWNGCKNSENLVDGRVPKLRDSHASSSHEPSSEPARCADLGKHSVNTNFPKDRNFEICQRTKITRAPHRRRIVGAVRRAENFGDLMTEDHKVLSEGCESRHIIDMQSWCRTWPSNGSSRKRAKQKLLRRSF